MLDNYGVVLLDDEEALFTIYTVDKRGKAQVLFQVRKILPQCRSGRGLSQSQSVEVVAEFFYKGAALNVRDWRLAGRQIPDELVRVIAKATGLPIENLREKRERELLMLGLLSEML